MVVLYALDVLEEAEALSVELPVELLGDVLDIEGGFEAVGDFEDGDVAFGVQFADIHHHAGELAEKEVARLAFDVQVIAGMGFAAVAFDPVPEALAAGGIEEDEQVFEVLLGHLFLDGGAGFGIRDAIGGFDFEHHHTRQLGNRGEGVAESMGFG